MSRLNINIGTTTNDRTGDPLRTAFEKVNTNFIELYNTVGADAPANKLVNGVSEVVLDEGGMLTVPGTIAFQDGVITSNDLTDPGIVLGSSDKSVFVRTLSGIDQYTWRFGTDGTLTSPSGATQTSTGSINCQINVDTVVFTSSQAGIQTIKLLLQVEGAQGSGQTHTQSCEMVVAKGFNGPTVAASVYGIVYTSLEPLATFTADWNPTLLRVEVTCRPSSLINGVNVKAFATEITTSD